MHSYEYSLHCKMYFLMTTYLMAEHILFLHCPKNLYTVDAFCSISKEKNLKNLFIQLQKYQMSKANAIININRFILHNTEWIIHNQLFINSKALHFPITVNIKIRVEKINYTVFVHSADNYGKRNQNRFCLK